MNIKQIFSKQQLAQLVNLNLFLLEELEDSDSEVSQYVGTAIVRIVLEQSSVQERSHFKQILKKQGQEAATDWILTKAKDLKQHIFRELNLVFTQGKMQVIDKINEN